MGKAVLLALVGVGDWDALELVFVVIDNDLLFVADDDQQFVGTYFNQLLETELEIECTSRRVGENGPAFAVVMVLKDILASISVSVILGERFC